MSANVLNLPLRQPPPCSPARRPASTCSPVAGRASGSGRLLLGCRAGGRRRLTPLQGVAALSEAIDVIRGIWDADGPGTLTADGEFYQVHGAERGPAPAHEIPIWLGAHKPRMQDLVGRKADGWLPSLPVMEPGGLPKGNAIIDDAARAAGRDPREITRLLNIFPDQQTPEALAQMTLERRQHLHPGQRQPGRARTLRRRNDPRCTRTRRPRTQIARVPASAPLTRSGHRRYRSRRRAPAARVRPPRRRPTQGAAGHICLQAAAVAVAVTRMQRLGPTPVPPLG